MSIGDIPNMMRIAALEAELAKVKSERDELGWALDAQNGINKELLAELAKVKDERDALKQSINRFHHIMHKAGLHPGRTDDDLLEILERHFAERDAAVAKERESIASEMDCACDCRDAVLDMMRTHGRRLAKHKCTFSTQCCAIEAAEIRARGDK